MLDYKLYVITLEEAHPGRRMLQVMEEAIVAGAGIVQLRNKTGSLRTIYEQAQALRELTQKYDVPLIINDHVDIAIAVNADGVHLGQDDMPVAAARTLLGADKIIGVSTSKIEQAREAQRAGVDYIGVGPIYPTTTKDRAPVGLPYIRQAVEEIDIPFVAIGGIDLSNVDEVIAAGAEAICVVSHIVGSDDVAGTCRAFCDKLQRAAELKEE